MLLEFIDTFEQHHESVTDLQEDDMVPCAEFLEYYGFVSAGFNPGKEGDSEFCRVVEGVWAGESPKEEEAKKVEKSQPAQKKYFYLGQTRPSYKRGASNRSSEENMLSQEAKLEKQRKSEEQQTYAVKLADDAISAVRATLAKRGLRALLGVAKALKELDPKSKGQVSVQEFRSVLAQYRIGLGEDGTNAILSRFDTARTGIFDYPRFVAAIKDTLPLPRRQQADQAFAMFPAPITSAIMKDLFDPRRHPDVESGKASREGMLLAFCDTLDLHAQLFFPGEDNSSVVSKERFADYFAFVSATVENDDKFAQVVLDCWKLHQVSESKPKHDTKTQHGKSLLHPPFGTSSEPTQYVTTKQFMSIPRDKKPLSSEEKLWEERRLFEIIKSGLKSGGLRKIFSFLRALFKVLSHFCNKTSQETGTEENGISPSDIHTLMQKFNIALTPGETEKVFHLFDPEFRGAIDDPTLISTSLTVLIRVCESGV